MKIIRQTETYTVIWRNPIQRNKHLTRSTWSSDQMCNTTESSILTSTPPSFNHPETRVTRMKFMSPK